MGSRPQSWGNTPIFLSRYGPQCDPPRQKHPLSPSEATDPILSDSRKRGLSPSQLTDTNVAGQETRRAIRYRAAQAGRSPYVDKTEQAPASSSTKKTGRSASREPTRIKWAWATLILGLVLGIALVDFLVQNTRSVRMEFFSASGQIPIVGALLVAALAGAAVALIVGSARIRQLRHRLTKTTDASTHDTAKPGSGSASRSSKKTAA